jgi:predicted ATPase/DNA-binding CsgD family transcriptional regulator
MLRTGGAMEANLPVSLTSFVGRERELNELGQLLRKTRLVTLTGPGGCGKTRLAVETARRLLPDQADGACFVDLSTLTSDGHVVSSVAQAAGLAAAAAPDLEALVRSLSRRTMLVLIDNCEHLLEEAATVDEALAKGCPELRLLTTSREPLGAEGELVYRVRALGEADAVRLFADRAHNADAAFRLDDANTQAVAAICRRLDGMPLALELAAAHAVAMTPEQILERLDQRFRLLVGRRSAVARHQSLRATVEWSEALLTEPERTLFRRLGVFVGGFDLAAAEAVAGGPELPVEEVLPLLRRLVERSLVQFEQRQDMARYRLLETLCEHAVQRLVDADEAQWVRDAHATHFTAIAWQQVGHSTSAYPDWPLLHREVGNFRVSLEHAQAAGSQSFAELAAWLTPFWMEVRLGEGRSWMEAALATEPDNLYIRYRLAAGLGILTGAQGEVGASREYFRRALAICEQRSDNVGAARVLANMAAGASHMGDTEASLDYSQRAERLAREAGDAHVLRLALTNLAVPLAETGELDRALVVAEESVELATEIGDPYRRRQSLNGLVSVHFARGEVETALALQRDALRIDQPTMLGEFGSLANMVALLSTSGQPASAVRLAGALESNLERLGVQEKYDVRFQEALAQAIEALGPRAPSIRESGRRMSLEEARAFALQEPGSESPYNVRLTRREVEVAKLVHGGLTDAQIAKRLFISLRTAESHLQSLRNKLGVSNRAEVAVWVAENLTGPTSRP